MQKYWQEVKQNWRIAWKSRHFRTKFSLSLVAIGIIVSSFSAFFQLINSRQGSVLHDWVLEQIPPADVSLLVFFSIWSVALLSAVRFLKNPALFLTFLIGYGLVTLCRFFTIYFFPLNPPPGLVELTDPISNAFYGDRFVTKDLFFSGHTSSVFLMFLCLQKPADKWFALVATLLVGAGVLIHHVHYTIDVLAAPVFTWLVWLAARKLAVVE